MDSVKKQRLGNLSKLPTKNQFSKECIVGVRVRADQRRLPDNSRAGDTIDLLAAVPAVDHGYKSHMWFRSTYYP
jgi:hypothetical protein